MSERKVKIESTVKYPVVISLPEFRYSRTFNRELQSTTIDFEAIEEGLQRPGFRNLVYSGIIRVADKQDRIDLGLEAASEDDDIDPIIALDTKEIISYLRGDNSELKSVLKQVSSELLQRFVNVAITSKITDGNVINALEFESKERGANLDMAGLLKLAKDAEAPVATDEKA